jgi:hypothetical protein
MPETFPDVEARWSSPFSADAWARTTAARSGAEVAGADPDEVVVLGPVLPSGADSRLAEVFAFHRKDSPSIHWTLNVRAPPDETPPENIQDTDAQLGGRAGLAKLLSDAVGAHSTSRNYTVRECFNASEWACSVLPRAVTTCDADIPIRKLDASARVEHIGYRFVGRVDGIAEVYIIYGHERECFHVTVVATESWTTMLGDDIWLPHARSVLLTIRDAVFEHKGNGNE